MGDHFIINFLLFLLLHSQFYPSSCSLGPDPAPVSFFPSFVRRAYAQRRQ